MSVRLPGNDEDHTAGYHADEGVRAPNGEPSEQPSIRAQEA